MLVRLGEKEGFETLVLATGDARSVFSSLEKWRIYDIEFSGSCVKTAHAALRYNIKTSLEVKVSYQCKITYLPRHGPSTIHTHFRFGRA